MVLTMRRSSSKLTKPTGVWSVRTSSGFLAEGIAESNAWDKFLRHRGDAILLRGDAPMAKK